MVMKVELIKKIRSSFSLNEYEARIWLALLSKGAATAGELAEISEVPRSRCYDVLESLEKKGFIVMKLGKPIKYLAIEPKEVVERVKVHIARDAESQIDMIREVGKTAVFDELDLLFKNGVTHIDPTNISGAIKGRANLNDHMETMIRNAKNSVVIVTTEKGLKRKSDRLGYLLRKVAKKGVKVKVAAPSASKDLVDDVKIYGEFKRLKDLNSRFLVVDSKEILFMLNEDDKVHDSYDIGIWSSTPLFAKAVNDLFELKWRS